MSEFELPKGLPGPTSYSWSRVCDLIGELMQENAVLKAVLKETIRTYILADEAWDPEADTERIMEDKIRRYYDESNLPSGSY